MNASALARRDEAVIVVANAPVNNGPRDFTFGIETATGGY